MKNKLTLTYLIFLTFSTHAQISSTTSKPNEVVLTIVPHICIAPRGESSCISTIDISWKSSSIGNYCLESDTTDNKLECWQNESSGFHQHKLVFSKNITYLMSDELTKITLANATMKFKSLKPHRKYKKRRSRFPWSIGTP